MSDTNEWNKRVIEEFRANDGKVGGDFEKVTLLLLHTTGVKSGLPRINPVATLPDGEGYVIMASKGGRPTHPDWYYNLVADPEVTVEVGADKFEALAKVTEGPERSALFNKMAAKYPIFSEYQEKTTRVIPVITLTPLR
ncbi:nitroreductase family deazaflavin-dependent oxidoreductase [Chloroflexota bacterium]